jgi:hypothetical protein
VAIEVGQKVKVRRLRDRLPEKVVSQLKQNSVGTVEGYKIVDGSGIGFVVKFNNSFATWFFEDEIEAV